MTDHQAEKSRGPRDRDGERRGPTYARALFAELPAKPGDVRAIASSLQLDIREVEADGFEGALIRARDIPLGAIVLRKSIREESRKNFTIAHEIGHFVLPGHDRASLACAASDVANWADASRAKNLEREADEFAAELLMPASLVEAISKDAPPSLPVIEKLAREAGASLSAAAWRYCDVVREKCAVVWSTDGAIQWVKRSAGFPFFLPTGLPVKEGTFAAACFSGNKVPSRPWGVAAHLWVSSPDLNQDAAIWEQSKALPSYRSVLSLLWIRRSLQEGGGSRAGVNSADASGESSKNKGFPATIKVKVATLDYGPQTRTFGRVFSFLFEENVRRSYTVQIGRGNGRRERGVFTFHPPPDFGNLSGLDQAKALLRQLNEAKRQGAELGYLPGLDEDSLREKDVYCSKVRWGVDTK